MHACISRSLAALLLIACGGSGPPHEGGQDAPSVDAASGDGGQDAYRPDAEPADSMVFVDADELDAPDSFVDAASFDGGTDDAGLSDAGDDAGCRPPFDVVWSGAFPSGAVCTTAGWCWVSPEAPLTSGYTTTTSAAGTLWVGGASPGSLLSFDGTAWRGLVGAVHPIDLAASGPSDVWVLEASNSLWHLNGDVLARVSLPTTFALTSVAAAGPTDAWVIGQHGAVLHWDGTSWSPIDPGIDVAYDVTSIHVAGSDDVWIGGSDGVVRHYDGAAWTSIVAPAPVTSVWASPGGTDLVVGPSFSRWNGTAWTTLPGRSHGPVLQISGATASSLFVRAGGVTPLNFYWNGAMLEYAATPAVTTSDVAPFGAGFALVGLVSGGSGDGVVMSTLGPASPSPVSMIGRSVAGPRAVVPFSDRDVVVYTASAAYRGDPVTRSFVPAPELIPPGLAGPYRVIGWTDDSDVWIDGGMGIVRHFDGTSWRSHVVSPGATVALSDANGSVYALAGTTLYRFDGTAFVVASSVAPPDIVIASGVGGEVWTTTPATTGAQVYSLFDGSSWASIADPVSSRTCVRLTSEALGSAKCLSGVGRLTVDRTGVAAVSAIAAPAGVDNAIDGVVAGNAGWLSIVPVTSLMEYSLWTGCGLDQWAPAGVEGLGASRSFAGTPTSTLFRVIAGIASGSEEIVEWRH